MKIPIDCYSILDVLKLNHYQDVLQILGFRERHIVCIYIINSILDKETIIPTEDEVRFNEPMLISRRHRLSIFQVKQLLTLLTTLLIDQADGAAAVSGQNLNNEDFVEEQNLVARLCNNLRSPDDADEQYRILKASQEVFKDGGIERMRFTYPPVIMQSYALAFRYKSLQNEVGNFFS